MILFCLPPHVTHLAQPLDKTVFSPLKRAWHEECQLYMANNPGKVVSCSSFMSLFSSAWLKAMHPSNIISGFRSTGVFPFDRTAIHVPGLEKENKDTDSLAISSGLAYIPLYIVQHLSDVRLRKMINSQKWTCVNFKSVTKTSTTLHMIHCTTNGPPFTIQKPWKGYHLLN